MPAESEEQKKAACLAIAIKRGKASGSKYPISNEMAKSMSMKDLKDYCTQPVKRD